MTTTIVRTALVALVLAASASGCAKERTEEVDNMSADRSDGSVRAPAVAGAFYPGDAATLAAEVDGYLDEAEVADLDGDLVALISPHAGYMYSGGVAALSYVLLREREFDTVVVIAPSHRYGFRGVSVFGGSGYETPLGVVPVDGEMASSIRDASGDFHYEPRAHAAEHSLEVQVPFLQRTLGGFRIVPIVMGEQDEGTVRALAEAVARAARDAAPARVLLVASTDLSHFHPYDEAVALDSVVQDAVERFDPEGLLSSLRRGDCEACGGGPAAAVMVAARELGADGASVLGYRNSGDVTGDRSGVVGYMAAALTRAGAGEDPGARSGAGRDARGDSVDDGGEPRPYQGLTGEEREALLRLARGTIEAALEGAKAPEVGLSTPALEAECGAFVTLHKKGRLRGCIGYVVAVKPLQETVAEMAIQASQHDPRFPPVEAGELDEIDIEISVMSPLELVGDVSEIEVGRDGLVVQYGGRSGLLLPQVATEYGWDRETFLEHTCLKAGLSGDAWQKDGVEIRRFTAEVFGEK